VTGSGKLTRRHAMQSHNLTKKSSKRKRAFAQKTFEVAKNDVKSVKKLLGRS
jgi:ribosomal protein L35